MGTESEDEDLRTLGAAGHVAPPSAETLDAAREILWSAVAQELLPDSPAGDANQDNSAGRTEPASRRRRTPPAPPPQHRREGGR